jgi:hypothetical protein
MKLVVALAAAMAALALAGPANAGWTTFGDTTAGPSIDTLSVNLKEVSKYTAVQGNIVRVTAYVSGLGAASGTQNVKAIVYRDSNGSPGARLGVSYEVTISAGRAWGWVVFPFLTPVPVHPSETVWIGFIASSTSDLTQAAITTPAGNQLLFNTDNYSTGPTDPFGSGTWRAKHYSLNATVDQPTIFGDTTAGGSWDALPANTKRAAKFTATAGSVTKVSAYVSGSATAGSQTIKAVIYSDSGGSPQTLLGTSNAVTVTQNQAARWIDFTFPSPVSVSAGSLWIGFIANTTGGIARIAYTSSTGGLRFNNDTYSDGAANPFGTASSANEHFTIYASLAPATPLTQRVGMNVPNIGTNNVSATYATTVFNDDGITLYRDAAPMSATYGSGSTPNWLWFDRDLNFAKTVPGSMLLTFATAPDWMHPSNSGAWYPPDSSHYQAWADKVVEVIGHAIANGVSVNKIELWNEPWLTNFWLPVPNPTAYEQLVTTTANTVWATYPTMQIGISADYYEQGAGVVHNTPWFQSVLNADGTGALNDSRYYFTTHNYTESDPPWKTRETGYSFDRYSLAHDQAVAHGFTNPHVDVTEYGWRAGDTSGGTNDVSVDTQAQYTIDAARQALATGYVDRVFLFEDYPGDTWGYNVHYPNGTVKPVASALKSYISTG